MTLVSSEACFQPDVATYLNICSIVYMNYAASLAVPDVKKYIFVPFGRRPERLFCCLQGAAFRPQLLPGFLSLLRHLKHARLYWNNVDRTLSLLVDLPC